MPLFPHEPDADRPAAPPRPALPRELSHRVIRASAGSGKTYRLTLRYLGLLLADAEPDRILATTFTRKAAGEILARVLGRVAAAAGDDSARRSLAEDVKDLLIARHKVRPDLPRELTADECVALARRLALRLHRLSIGTMDGFFAKAASVFHHELNLPPDPQRVDDRGPVAQQLRLEAIDAMLADAAADEQAGGFQTLVLLLRGLYSADEARRSVTETIDRLVTELYDLYRLAPDPAAWSSLKFEGLLDRDAVAEAVDRVAALADDIPTTKRGKPKKHWANNHANLVEAAVANDWDAVLGLGLVEKVLAGEDSFDRTPIPAAWADAITPLAAHAAAMQLDQVRQQTRATYQLLRRFDAQFTALRRRRGVVLFSDITRALAEGFDAAPPPLPPGGAGGGTATTRPPTAGSGPAPDPSRGQGDRTPLDRDALYYRLDGRVRHLLLDEFQDTSLDQWRVLAPLAEEITAQSTEPRSFFCVGDAKQAIYGWRGGCAELFDTAEALPGLDDTAVERLEVSYRSTWPVLNAVNETFADIGSSEPLQHHAADRAAAGCWAELFDEHRPYDGRGDADAGHVTLETSLSTDAAAALAAGGAATATGITVGPGDLPMTHDRYAAKRIAALHAADPGKSIGVLVQRNAAVKALRFELARLGVRASGEGGNPVTDAPAVAAVLSALTLADHPGHTAAAFHVVNSPMGGVVGLRSTHRDAVRRVSTAIRRRLLDRGYPAVLAEWARRLAASCDAAGLERLTQLVELADGFDDPSLLRPSRFVAHVRATAVESASSAGVRVMTLFRAKGLTFDITVLPELNRRLDDRGLALVHRPSPTAPVDAVYRRPAAGLRSRSPQLEEAYHQMRQAERHDDLCGLYVAMTRPKHGLHMIVEPLREASHGGPTGRGLRDLSYAAILRGSLAETDESYEGGEVLYERGDGAWLRPTDSPPPATKKVRDL